MGERLTERDFEGEFCLDCILHGEPNGCNKPGGTCNAYDFCFEAWDKLAEYEALGTPAELAELAKARDEGRLLLLKKCQKCGLVNAPHYRNNCDRCGALLEQEQCEGKER